MESIFYDSDISHQKNNIRAMQEYRTNSDLLIAFLIGFLAGLFLGMIFMIAFVVMMMLA